MDFACIDMNQPTFSFWSIFTVFYGGRQKKMTVFNFVGQNDQKLDVSGLFMQVPGPYMPNLREKHDLSKILKKKIIFSKKKKPKK